jgi:hypothetical protein
MDLPRTIVIVCLACFFFVLQVPSTYGQEASLEQRQPLELVFADSIVPQDRHEMMLTTGGWYSRQRRDVHDALLTQKIEWGLSDKLQISAFVNALHSSNQNGPTATGMGDFEVGARYTWATVGSPFTHIAVAFDAGFPSFSVSSNRWNGGNETQLAVTPSYIWRLARRTELLLGVPIGLTSSTNRIGGVIKFTFELGGPGE